MAQVDDIYASNAQGTQLEARSKSSKTSSPTFQQLLQGEASSWSPTSSPRLRKNHDHDDDHHNKKSVLSKVKEKAKKLKNSFSGRKHRDEDLRGPYTTPSWEVSYDDKEEEDAEYFGAPMYESELAPDTYRQAAKEHPREVNRDPSEKHVVTSSLEQRKKELPSSNKTTMEGQSQKQALSHTSASVDTIPKNHAAANADISQVHDLTETNPSKFSGLSISTTEGAEARGNPQMWDKGVSVKEYLMQKLEPGEGEKALSQVITETISPRRQKMREAMNTLLGSEEPSQSSSKISNSGNNISTSSADRNPNAGASLTAASSNQNPKASSDSSTVSSNLKPTLKSNVSTATNPNHNLGTSMVSNPSTKHSSPKKASLLHSPTKRSSSAGVHASAAKSTRGPVSAANQVNANATRAQASVAHQSQIHAYTRANAAHVPASTNSHEVVEDENRGRILQAN